MATTLSIRPGDTCHHCGRVQSYMGWHELREEDDAPTGVFTLLCQACLKTCYTARYVPPEAGKQFGKRFVHEGRTHLGQLCPHLTAPADVKAIGDALVEAGLAVWERRSYDTLSDDDLGERTYFYKECVILKPKLAAAFCAAMEETKKCE